MALGTAAMIGIGLASSAASNIYSTRAAAGENRRAVEAQRASEQQMLENERLQREAEMEWARQQQEWERQQLEYQRQAEQAQYEAYVQAHTPFWNIGRDALNTAAGMLGVPGMPGGGGDPSQATNLMALAQGVGYAPPAPPTSMFMPQGGPQGPAPPMAGGAPGVAAMGGPPPMGGQGMGPGRPMMGPPGMAPGMPGGSAAALAPMPRMGMGGMSGSDWMSQMGNMMSMADLVQGVG